MKKNEFLFYQNFSLIKVARIDLTFQDFILFDDNIFISKVALVTINFIIIQVLLFVNEVELEIEQILSCI